MASYREHLSFSAVIGVIYGVCSVFVTGFGFIQGAIAGYLTMLGGILPDLDSETGTPVRELLGISAAGAPLVLMQYLLSWGGDPERVIFFGIVIYMAIRFAGPMILSRLTVHRGMFHSIPAMLIAGLIVYLIYRSNEISVRMLMGIGIALGYFSHLLLDEIYSVQWNGLRVRLKKSAGSAIKLMSKLAWPNIVTYGILFALGYGSLIQTNRLIEQLPPPEMVPPEQMADAPVFPHNSYVAAEVPGRESVHSSHHSSAEEADDAKEASDPFEMFSSEEEQIALPPEKLPEHF